MFIPCLSSTSPPWLYVVIIILSVHLEVPILSAPTFLPLLHSSSVPGNNLKGSSPVTTAQAFLADLQCGKFGLGSAGAWHSSSPWFRPETLLTLFSWIYSLMIFSVCMLLVSTDGRSINIEWKILSNPNLLSFNESMWVIRFLYKPNSFPSNQHGPVSSAELTGNHWPKF